MANKKLTFDQLVYLIVALPAIFLASYVLSAVVVFFAFGSIARFVEICNRIGLGFLVSDETVSVCVLAVLLIIPASLMTRHFFAAGWPESKTTKVD